MDIQYIYAEDSIYIEDKIIKKIHKENGDEFA